MSKSQKDTLSRRSRKKTDGQLEVMRQAWGDIFMI